MVRITKQKAAENRAHVLQEAARLFRERGLDAPSVAELMKAAGMTHGGFYNHFASKADLQVSALELTFEQAVARVAAVSATPRGPRRRAALAAYVERYLSAHARSASGAGCPMVAFSADVSREDDAVQRAYADGLERYIGALADLWANGDAGSPDGRHRAVRLLAPLVGGLSLARSVATADPAFSDEILTTVRDGLIDALDELLPAQDPLAARATTPSEQDLPGK